ncbi:hypothetical protein AB0D34_42095 [Streptomyces sp. NPDC048420]|uniref:hypothetical protein n=1 Tax=Streptomyces sp. NPDC048420 TaxID=3155755 RepID=UPI003418CECE
MPVERRAAAPVLPPAMLGSRTVVFSSLIGFFANAAMFAVLVYLPTYLQIVQGVSATLSGIYMLPRVAGLVISQSERRSVRVHVLCPAAAGLAGRHRVPTTTTRAENQGPSGTDDNPLDDAVTAVLAAVGDAVMQLER